jgi:hypothetical protein
MNRYFSICKNKNVLEIGPFGGHHSKMILEQQPTELTVVEPNIEANDQLAKLNISNIINDDIFHYLQSKNLFDVVICCGVLYHLPHPLYLLELIANMSDPEYLILESICVDKFYLTNEIDNTPGNRQINDSWKSCKLNLLIPDDYYETIAINLGYELIHKDSINLPDILGNSKHNSWISLWKKVK